MTTTLGQENIARRRCDGGVGLPAVRPAFTLIELLVVITVLAMLMGLMMQGVQGAREMMRRSHCQNNMRQVGLAFVTCAESRQWMPAACYTTDAAKTTKFPQPPVGNPSRREHSWRVLVMPFMEHSELASQYNLKKHWYDATSNSTPASASDATLGVPPDSNLGVATRSVPLFRCPSAPQGETISVPKSPDSDSARPAIPALGVNPGRTDYEAMTGVKPAVLSPDPYAAKGDNSKGMLDKDVVTRPRNVIDGMSKTILLVECAGRPQVYRAGKVQQSGTVPAVNQCVGWADNLGPFKLDPMTAAGVTGAAANAGLPFNASNDGEAYSFHSGGIGVVFGDAGTRFLADGMNLRVFCGLVTRAGGEAVSADD